MYLGEQWSMFENIGTYTRRVLGVQMPQHLGTLLNMFLLILF